MRTRHKVFIDDARRMSLLEDETIDLIVTSPPYPMIDIWDKVFIGLNPAIGEALAKEKDKPAFELMHKELDKVWRESYRVLKKGGFACINIGDAARSIGGKFQLFINHSRLVNFCVELGFFALPPVLWRKPTNAPNKFMGSGMLPAGAYVTLEHEFILIMRKGFKRSFCRAEEKKLRYESAYFWEERNAWFSDVWTGPVGVKQRLATDLVNKGRKRSGAFPFELAYRLVNMYSVKDDLVLDPFAGTGTTMLACMAAQRNSLSIEIDPNFKRIIDDRAINFLPVANEYIEERILRHHGFVKKRRAAGKLAKYFNEHHGFPVITKQEEHIRINRVEDISRRAAGDYIVDYATNNSDLACQS